MNSQAKETSLRYVNVSDNRKITEAVAERHELALLFDVAMANPNGDPDSGNAPRTEPDSLGGYVTDVCLKRKIRNFFSQHKPNGDLLVDGQQQTGYQIFIAENAVLKNTLDASHQRTCVSSFGELLKKVREQFALTDEQVNVIREEMVCEKFPEKPKQLGDFVLKAAKKVIDDKFVSKLVLSKLSQHACQEVQRVASDVLKQEKAGGLLEALKATAKSQKVKPKVVEEVYQEVAKQFDVTDTVNKYFGQNEAERFLVKMLCENYFDVRAFGAVVSTKGPLAGSFNGQIRGPAQFTFSRSLDKILVLEPSITRCATASDSTQSSDTESPVDQQPQTDDSGNSDNRTMGRKPFVKYGLYRCSIHISPAFAAKTGFSYQDMDNFLFALVHMFVDDHAAGRHLRLVGLVDFQHTSSLGNAPAHKLFDMVKVEGIKDDMDGKKVFKSSGSEFPQGLYDYHGSAPGGLDGYEPVPGFEPKNGEKTARITARKLVWEIPEMRG